MKEVFNRRQDVYTKNYPPVIGSGGGGDVPAPPSGYVLKQIETTGVDGQAWFYPGGKKSFFIFERADSALDDCIFPFTIESDEESGLWVKGVQIVYLMASTPTGVNNDSYTIRIPLKSMSGMTVNESHQIVFNFSSSYGWQKGIKISMYTEE